MAALYTQNKEDCDQEQTSGDLTPPQKAKSTASASAAGKQMPYYQEPQSWDVEAEKVRPTCEIIDGRSSEERLYEDRDFESTGVTVDATCSAYTHSFSFFGTIGELRAFLDGMLMSGYCELRTLGRPYDDSHSDELHQVIRSLRFRRDGEDDWQSFYEDEDLGADRNFGKHELEFEPDGQTRVYHEDDAYADLYPTDTVLHKGDIVVIKKVRGAIAGIMKKKDAKPSPAIKTYNADTLKVVFRGWRARRRVHTLKAASAELYEAKALLIQTVVCGWLARRRARALKAQRPAVEQEYWDHVRRTIASRPTYDELQMTWAWHNEVTVRFETAIVCLSAIQERGLYVYEGKYFQEVKRGLEELDSWTPSEGQTFGDVVASRVSEEVKEIQKGEFVYGTEGWFKPVYADVWRSTKGETMRASDFEETLENRRVKARRNYWSASQRSQSLCEFFREAKALLIQTAFRGWRARRRLQHEQEWSDFLLFGWDDYDDLSETQARVLGTLFKEHGLSPEEFCRRRRFFERFEFVQVREIFEGEGGCCGGCGDYYVEIGYPSDFHPTLPICGQDTTVTLSTEIYRLDEFVNSPLEITEIGNEGWMCCSGVSGHVVGKPEWVSYELAFGETRAFTADELICALRDESPLRLTIGRY